jgi:hypothetical protein
MIWQKLTDVSEEFSTSFIREMSTTNQTTAKSILFAVRI